jgi:Ser/Thr protein kinase RdoA (MazF antagonist)
MTQYTDLTRRGQIRRLRRLAKQSLALYGVEPASLSLLSHMFNTTFAVAARDGARYVLRIQRAGGDQVVPTPTRSRTESEVWWLDRLRADLDVPVPVPVRTPDGESVVSVSTESVPEPRLCVLFEWMDGHFFHNRLMPAHLEQVGRMTALLHEHSAGLTIPPTFDRQQVDNADAQTEEAIVRLFTDHCSPEAARVMRDVLLQVRRAAEELGSAPSMYGLIHGDIHQENYLFHRGTVRLIDFDDCGWGHYLHDLAVTTHEIDFLPRGPALTQALLGGYRRVRDLPASHETAIAAFYMLRELHITSWYLEQRNNLAITDSSDHVKWGVAMLERLLAG